MIIKSFQLEKLKEINLNIFLLYGENEGFKNQVIKEKFLKNFIGEILKYDENEILTNFEDIISTLLNKSFFNNKKILIISRATDKLLKFIEEINERNITDTIIILNSNILDKKSKIRILFEKNKKMACIPFYADDQRSLNNITYNFLKKTKINLSQELINIIVEKSQGDRNNLIKELEKLENFTYKNKKISSEELLKLTNLAENYSVSELTNSCLIQNIKKTITILNENNYSSDDCLLILRSLLQKTKRLLKLKENFNQINNLDEVISSYRPTIFWKEKDLVKQQIQKRSLNNIKNLIIKINEIEILIKKNTTNSIHLLSDFILDQTKVISS